MSIFAYNSLTRQKELFNPLAAGKVSMYVCGPTVYDQPHIGHARSAYVFDVIRRYFEYRGYQVIFVRNVTDVDDKIINKAKEEFKNEDLNTAVQKVSLKYLDSYHKYMDTLGIKPPTMEPKATEYIDKMQKFIALLIERKTAYESDGDVYFDITQSAGYGKLSNQSLEMLESGARVAPDEKKRNPLDFALWKRVKPEEPFWDSPWGPGRPGWHIECSVMSSDILGDEFDIHGGGIDLIFPHHENEAAQSAAAGKKFARYWLHNGLLTINKEKMAKSLGNFITMQDLLSKYPAIVLKLLFLQTHYSNPMDFSWERMRETKKAYERIGILMGKLGKIEEAEKLDIAVDKEAAQFRRKFIEAMDDDFNTPQGLAVLFDIVNKCNKLLENNDESGIDQLRGAAGIIREITAVFGLKFFEETVFIISDEEVEKHVALRQEYRKQKNFKESDRIRKELEEKGVVLEDTRESTTWRRKL